MKQRASGVLMHVSSLPGAYGIGCFGKEARQFIDFLADAGCTYWQVLPFTPTDSFNSPYASISAFAGNRNFIDLEQLRDEGLLTDDELREQMYANPYSAAFEFLSIRRIPVLYRAFTRADENLRQKVREFAEKNSRWLPDYALYIILKEAFLGKEWYDWPDEALKMHEEKAVEAAKKEHAETVLFMEFIQYTFYTQWEKLRKYANDKGVEIIGDLPMYVARQSSDVWANRHLFDLTEDGEPKNVAGVPPDYFSEFGQKWGNPLYNWAEMKRDGYRWWMDRLGATFALFDAVRIDHFRALSAYWAVPAEAETAKDGEWLPGPGMDFFKEVRKNFGDAKIIAEDLGIIDEGVVELLEQTGLPCMRVMQFGFSEMQDNMHLPHNHPKNSVAYTGTHDNNTLLGWLWEAQPHEREYALNYCGFPGGDWAVGGYDSASCRAMIRTLWQSPANTVIVPVQDLCGFGKDTKMNVPGVPNGNWAFRLSADQMAGLDAKWLRGLNNVYYRTMRPKPASSSK